MRLGISTLEVTGTLYALIRESLSRVGVRTSAPGLDKPPIRA
jgi:hypothetical protein